MIADGNSSLPSIALVTSIRKGWGHSSGRCIHGSCISAAESCTVRAFSFTVYMEEFYIERDGNLEPDKRQENYMYSSPRRAY